MLSLYSQNNSLLFRSNSPFFINNNSTQVLFNTNYKNTTPTFLKKQPNFNTFYLIDKVLDQISTAYNEIDNINDMLESYNLLVKNTYYYNKDKAFFTTKYIGKKFFDDYYKVYKHQLSKFLPEVPEIPRYWSSRGF
jgi:hypothetical protein